MQMNKNDFSDNDALLVSAAQGDLNARNTLVTNNMGLVYSVVKRFGGRGFESEDLIQIGAIGLIRAAERFDMSYGVKFSTYAIPMIIGEIKRFIRDDGIIKVSRSLKETAAAAAAVKKRIEDSEGREATVTEIAKEMNISAAELSAALNSQVAPCSIYAAADDGTGEGKALVDKIEEGENQISRATDKIVIRQLIADLDERDGEIVKMRYFCHKTQEQVAQKLGISQVQVSRLEKKILAKLRHKLGE